MNEAGQPHQTAAVLVIAADPNIESLVGELVAFAGHRPLYDVTMGAAGESVRRARPDVALIDTALPVPVVRACLGAADELGSRVVLMSSTANAAELEEQAAAEHALHFTLPGGPKQLRQVLERALERQPERDVAPVVYGRTSARTPGSMHPSLCAALATIARTQALSTRQNVEREQTRTLRGARGELLGEARRSQAALRAAVTDFTTQLRSATLPEEEAVLRIREVVSECAAFVGAEEGMDALLADSEQWARDVYHTA